MKKTSLLSILFVSSLFATQSANAQDDVVCISETFVTELPAKTHYYSTASDNWFIQMGAGIQSPFVENYLANGKQSHKLTATYNLGFGKWMNPYLAWRLSFLGGAMRWNNHEISKAKTVSGNLDFMWDMFNSLGGVNSNRRFSIVPFVGLGGAYTWDFKAPASNVYNRHGKIKNNQWTLPVSAGLQLRFRLCKYADLFFEGRAQFHGDNFNNCVYGEPVDVNISAIGGFSFNIGGSDFRSYDSADYMGYIKSLNNQVNDLRGALATTSAALAEAEAQLPCPEVTTVQVVETAPDMPLMATVRFKINSDQISDDEAVNVYNIAQWMIANPEQNVTISGYADRNTGSSTYNMELSNRRAQMVYDLLVNKYGIKPNRLSIRAEGSEVQPYEVNNWNRIVIFSTN